MTRKRWCILTGALLVALVAALVALVVAVDPFEIYHRAWFYNPPYESETQMYAGAGVAKSYTYDSIIVGSSVTENCRPSVYDAALGGRFVKLSMNAGMSLDHAKMMEIAFRTHDVKRVVYGLDLFSYSYFPNNQKARTPDYLYDDILFNDVQYWFNKSVLFRHIPAALARIGAPDEDVSRDAMYSWTPPSLPGKDGLGAMAGLPCVPPTQDDPERFMELTQLSLEQNLLPYIRAHRDAEFIVFFPPYSEYYWVQQAAEGNLTARMAQKRQLAQALLAEENVQLYDFHTHTPWTQNPDLYYDLIHYIPSVNDEIAVAMKDGLCRVDSMAQIEESIAAIEASVFALTENVL